MCNFKQELTELHKWGLEKVIPTFLFHRNSDLWEEENAKTTFNFYFNKVDGDPDMNSCTHFYNVYA